MKNVLIIGMSPNHGGVETFILNVFNSLNNKKYNFYFIEENDKKIYAHDYIVSKGGKILKVKVPISFFGRFFRYRVAHSFFKKYNGFFDVVHLNCVTVNSVYWLKAAEHNNEGNLIIHSHNDKTSYKSILRSFLVNIYSRYNLRRLNRMNGVKRLSASNDAGKWMFGNMDFIVVPNGIDTNQFLYKNDDKSSMKGKLNLNNSKIILCVGRIEYQKNYDKVVDVFNKLLSIDSSYHLIICGNGSQIDNIRKKIKRLGISSHITFFGMVENIVDFYTIADVLLLPSRFEAFPYVLLESQSMGVPSVVSIESVPKEANVSGIINFMSLTDSDYRWAKKIISISENKINRISVNKRMKESKYDIHTMSKIIEDIYRN